MILDKAFGFLQCCFTLWTLQIKRSYTIVVKKEVNQAYNGPIAPVEMHPRLTISDISGTRESVIG
jgi:hypothetical protein